MLFPSHSTYTSRLTCFKEPQIPLVLSLSYSKSNLQLPPGPTGSASFELSSLQRSQSPASEASLLGHQESQASHSGPPGQTGKLSGISLSPCSMHSVISLNAPQPHKLASLFSFWKQEQGDREMWSSCLKVTGLEQASLSSDRCSVASSQSHTPAPQHEEGCRALLQAPCWRTGLLLPCP